MREKTNRLLAGTKELFSREGGSCEIERKSSVQNDPWDELDLEAISVDTEIEDFADNHDYYLYGTMTCIKKH